MCCEVPGLLHGYKRFILLGMLLLTWIFWNIAIFHCSFMKFGHEDIDWADRVETGIFTYPQYDGDKIYTCTVYHPDEDLSSAHKASRVFGAFGFVFHTSALLIVTFLELCVFWRAKILWGVVRGFLIASFICSLLIFSAYGEDICDEDPYKCAPGAGGIVAIFNIFLLIGAIVLSWLTAAPTHPFWFCRRWSEEDAVPEQRLPQDTNKAPGVAPAVDPTTTDRMDEPATPVPMKPPAPELMEVVPIQEEGNEAMNV